MSAPSVGRIVHYYPSDELDGEGLAPGPLAAIITGLRADSSVVLSVLPPMPFTDTLGNTRGSLCVVATRGEGEPGTPGTWCWPPRVS